MPVSKEQVLVTAALSRLDISISASGETEDAETRLARLASQMDDIVGYMDILNHVDTEGVEPLYSPMRDVAPPRADEATCVRTPDEVLANAPKRRQNFFVVPPAI